jgi:hyperosmotically inducible protein
MRIRTLMVATLFGLTFVAGVACTSLAQQGVVEKAAEKLDDVGRGLRRGASEITDAIRKRFEAVRTDVNRMETHSRVYSRLHWDKALNSSRFEVLMLRDGTVLLRGQVPDTAAKTQAVALARETFGVSAVVDELVPLVSETTENVVPARTR